MTPPKVIIRAPEGPVHVRIGPPPSKSVANRALILASLAGGLDGVQHFGEADDTRILHDLLHRKPEVLHCGDGGTTFRFLLAWACVQAGREHVVTGHARLLQRPHAPLVQALRELGADITELAEGFRVRGRQMEGGLVRIHAPESSQHISALLLVASRFRQGLRLEWTGRRLSTPYVEMTVKLCERFGIPVRREGEAFIVEAAQGKAVPITVPGDWSAASFWYQIAALSPAAGVELTGLQQDGLQGDQAVARLFSGLVATHPTVDGLHLQHRTGGQPGLFQADLSATPDLFQPMAMAVAGRGGEAHFTGLDNLPLKETDRLEAVADALRSLGCTVQHHHGTFHLKGPITNTSPAPFDPRGDHRMAMALAPLALVCNNVTILHPDVVNKSYPAYWDDLERAGFRLQFR